MRIHFILVAAIFTGCITEEGKSRSRIAVPNDTPSPEVKKIHQKVLPEADSIFSNKRFANVRIKKTGPDLYEVKGQAQIFEASFNWVVEDGHDELLSGHTMTDEGAPAWGSIYFHNFKAKS